MGKKLEEKLTQRELTFRRRVCETLNVSNEAVSKMFGEKYSCLRINTLKVNPSELYPTLAKHARLEEVTWQRNVYIIKEGKDSLTHNELFEQGAYYIQNLSSLLPVLALDPKPEENILDICAAPGGKTTFIAQLTNNQANLFINDESYTRLMRTKQICQKYGVVLAEAFNQPAQYLTRHTDMKFDAILIDAPCSGEGLINLNKPESLQYWSTKKINRLKKLQKRILDESYNLLKPGGRIVYATCTTAKEENEEVIASFLRNHLDVASTDIKLPIENTLTIDNSTHIIPNDAFQAFTISKLIKQ